MFNNTKTSKNRNFIPRNWQLIHRNLTNFQTHLFRKWSLRWKNMIFFHILLYNYILHTTVCMMILETACIFYLIHICIYFDIYNNKLMIAYILISLITLNIYIPIFNEMVLLGRYVRVIMFILKLNRTYLLI